MDSKEMDVVVIGAGIICHPHIESFCSSPNTQVKCLVDVNKTLAREVADQYEIPGVETDYRIAIAKYKPQLVLVGTPHYLHHRMVVDALKSGCHVICEKPLGMTVAECDEMIAVAEKNQKLLLVAHNMRATQQFLKIKQLIDSGRLGKIFLAELQFLGHEVDRMNDPHNWKGTYDEAGGGVLMDGGCHVVDLMNYYFGMPENIKSIMHRSVVSAKNKAEDNAMLIAEYRSKLMVNITASFTAKTQGSKQSPTLMLNVAVYGTDGSVYGGFNSSGGGWKLTLVESDEAKPCDMSDIAPFDLDRHFIDCILNNAQPLITAKQARDTVAIIETAYRQNMKEAESRGITINKQILAR